MTFSITIPAFKSQYLNEAIASVANQTYQNWELVIVDDCSQEDIQSIVMPYIADNRIHYYRNEKNIGANNVVDNWNKCLNYCTGDYIICMGDDDLLLPCCLEEYEKLILKFPNLHVYHTRTEIINDHGKVIATQEIRPEWESMVSLIWNRWTSRDKQFIGDFCYDTNYLKATGGYYKLPLAWGSDDLTATMAAKEKGIANTQRFGFQYRVSTQTITSSRHNARLKMEATLAQYKWYDRLLSELSTASLSVLDTQYLKTIDKPRKDYYYKSLGKNCTDYIKGNPIKLLECYRLLMPIHFSPLAFIKWYISSIYHLL